MDEDRLTGSATNLGGKVKEGAGKVQGNRANRLCCDEAGEVVVVPCGHLSPEA